MSAQQQVVGDLAAQAVRLLPDLLSLQLTLVPSHEMDDSPWLVFECYSERPECKVRDAVVAWYTWRAERLPFDAARHFMLSWVHHENSHAR